jgi:hypothetical protein
MIISLIYHHQHNSNNNSNSSNNIKINKEISTKVILINNLVTIRIISFQIRVFIITSKCLIKINNTHSSNSKLLNKTNNFYSNNNIIRLRFPRITKMFITS